jgi:branched-chain amino acid aminotransferase
MKIWIDDALVDERDAVVSVRDHGLLYGDGVFEGLRVYDRRVFRLDAHVRRLEFGARILGIALPGGIDRMREIVLATVESSERDNAYVRLVVTRGAGPLGVDPSACTTPRVICIVDDLELYPAEKREQGLDLITSTLRRPGADVLDPRVKSLNYLNNVQAKREALQRGADDALLLNAEACVAEATVANVFAYRDGVLRTPPATDGALEGITRQAVLELAVDLDVPAREERLGRIDLLAADEVFLSGTGIELIAVRSLDQTPIGTKAPGPLTRRLLAAFHALVRATDR